MLCMGDMCKAVLGTWRLCDTRCLVGARSGFALRVARTFAASSASASASFVLPLPVLTNGPLLAALCDRLGR